MVFVFQYLVGGGSWEGGCFLGGSRKHHWSGGAGAPLGCVIIVITLRLVWGPAKMAALPLLLACMGILAGPTSAVAFFW